MIELVAAGRGGPYRLWDGNPASRFERSTKLPLLREGLVGGDVTTKRLSVVLCKAADRTVRLLYESEEYKARNLRH